MKALYFDLSSGISGNMTLGALTQLIDDENYLEKELSKLNVEGYHLIKDTKNKNGIQANFIDVALDEHHHDHHEHEHHHEHVHRHLSDVNKIIDDASIDPKAKDLAKRIFLRVAKAEAKVHHMPLEEVHFHEVGAIDSIVDIIGTAILITKINPDVIYSSVVCDGHGQIECAHGLIPVPVPATVEILSERNALTKQIDIDTELVTPTGAAIISELAKDFTLMPTMKVLKTVYSCGTKDLKIPNVLRVILGEIEDHQDDVIVIETNIDDSTAEILGYVSNKLMNLGALDVFFTPIYMKKNRPAYRLTTVCKEENLEVMKDCIFEQTSTIGMRYRLEKRFVLNRSIELFHSSLGDVHIKVVTHNENTYKYPEYEDLKEIADKKHISLIEVYNTINKEL